MMFELEDEVPASLVASRQGELGRREREDKNPGLAIIM